MSDTRLYGASIASKKNLRDSAYWETDKVVRRIKSAPKTKRADRNDWRKQIDWDDE